MLTGKPLRVRTIAGFAPLIAGGLTERLAELLEVLDSLAFAGNLTAPTASALHEPRRAGLPLPQLLAGTRLAGRELAVVRSLIRAGETSRAAQIRRETLAQLAESGFAEYFEPFTGEPLGSHEQSWTAAVALDMLAVESSTERTEDTG